MAVLIVDKDGALAATYPGTFFDDLKGRQELIREAIDCAIEDGVFKAGEDKNYVFRVVKDTEPSAPTFE